MAEGDVLDLVNQFDQMRQGNGPNSGASPVGRPMQQPNMGIAKPESSADPYEGVEGPEVGAVPSSDQLALVDIGGGMKVDRSVIPDLAEVLQAAEGLRVVSAYRDAARNQREDGVPNSRHLYGLAVDIRGSAQGMAQAAATARTLGIPEVMLEGAHLHLGWDRSDSA